MPDTGSPYEIPFLDGTELVRAYPQFSEDLADAIVAGLDSVATTGFRFAGTRYFTSSGTFAKADPFGTGDDVGLRAVVVHVWGGGGAGGGSGTSSRRNGAWGGGSGGYSKRFYLAAELDASESVGVGSGGAGVDLEFGSNGQVSTFKGQTANGGLGGPHAQFSANSPSSPADGGSASGGDLNISGGGGTFGDYDLPRSGVGGDAPLGGSGGSTSQSATQTRNGNGGAFPGGGGGGSVSGSNTIRRGGSGAQGAVFIEVWV